MNLPIIDPTAIKLTPQQIDEDEDAIRNSFLETFISPHYFCCYNTFAKVFPPPDLSQAYTEQNLNIIDLHLRFHQFVFDEMIPYKWVPSLLFCIFTRFSTVSLVFPFFYTNLFDRYFKQFFVWLHKDENIINIRQEFLPKLSKQKNKLRRIDIFNRIRDNLNSNASIPIKYIKFGEYTQYIFHTTFKDEEQSNFCLTSYFDNYMFLKNLSWQSVKEAEQKVVALFQQFREFRKESKKQPIFINYQRLLKFKDIRKEQIYNVSKQIELRIRRMLEIGKYRATGGGIYMSGFTIADLVHFNKHYDLLQPQRFNYDSNTADLILFYSAVAIPKLMMMILKRRRSM